MTKLFQVLCNATSILQEREPSGSVQRSATQRASVCLFLCKQGERSFTCDCDTASGEHLYGGFEVFDPVRGRRVELWFVADRQGEEKRKTGALLHTDHFVWVFALDCIWLHKIKRVRLASKCWPMIRH